VPVVRKLEEWALPGGAANTAANLRALGAHVTFLGVVGSDTAGRALRDMVRARGIDDQYLVDDETVTTQHKLRILADGQYVVRFDEGSTHAPGAPAQQRLLAGLDALADECEVIVISDYCYGALHESLTHRAQEIRRRRGIPLIVDSKQLGRLGRIHGAVVTPNLLEARALVSARGGQLIEQSEANDTQGRINEGRRLAVALLSILDTQLAAVTLSRDGVALASRDGQQWHVAAHPVMHPNEVGAGDSFTSALALALAAGASPVEAARISVDAAGIAVSKRFTSQVEQRELLQRVSLRVRDDASTVDSGPATRRHAQARVRAMVELERAAGHVIVFTNGVFDVLHAGHIDFLRRAKALGDTLVVAVNSDDSVRWLAGARPPLMSERDRLALLAALDPVDYALLFDDETPAPLIRALQPHIHVKGGDYADENLPEADAVRETGGRVVIMPLAGAPDPAQSSRLLSWMRDEPEEGGSHVHAG
jgi:D-beta-D-heptose 7-phosphate kinase / D-beta-D-heptose 1-phosphate adenosyltransferase